MGLLLLLAAVEWGCTGKASESDVLTLERTGCYGPCPVYSIALHDDGRVVYQGRAFVKLVGEVKGQTERSTIDILRRDIRRSGLMALGKDCCDCYDITDHPGANIRYDFGLGERGSIDHHHGCEAAPAWLGMLEDRIDEVLQSKRFIGTPEERYRLFDDWPRRRTTR